MLPLCADHRSSIIADSQSFSLRSNRNLLKRSKLKGVNVYDVEAGSKAEQEHKVPEAEAKLQHEREEWEKCCSNRTRT